MIIAIGGFAVAGCGGSSSTATSAEATTTASPVADAVAGFNDSSNGLLAAWAKSVSSTPANMAAPSAILAPGYTCELVVTDTGVSLFLQGPGDSLPNGFDWTTSGGVVHQPRVPAPAPTGGTPCVLSAAWQVSQK